MIPWYEHPRGLEWMGEGIARVYRETWAEGGKCVKLKVCSECYGIGRHAHGCPDGDVELRRVERDPDAVLEDRRDRAMERARNVDGSDHLDRVARAKGYL